MKSLFTVLISQTGAQDGFRLKELKKLYMFSEWMGDVIPAKLNAYDVVLGMIQQTKQVPTKEIAEKMPLKPVIQLV